MSNSSSDSLILQLNALLPEIEDHLAKRATTVRWSDIDAVYRDGRRCRLRQRADGYSARN
jgi:hypothetical protein